MRAIYEHVKSKTDFGKIVGSFPAIAKKTSWEKPLTLHSASFADVVPAFENGEDTPSNFLERCIGQIKRHEPEVQAFEYLDIEGARRAAQDSSLRWKAGKPLSNIDGMPLGIKDVIETADMPTGMGSPLFTGIRTNRDSASVRALREAGAIIIGKTVTTEFAATFPGKTRNPWDPTRTPGGSSSGSAAGVAAGFFPAGLGTQVVGSIIRPASYCGVVGFKPSFGAVNRGGSFDHMSQSSQGVLAATLRDAWRVLQNIVQRAGGDAGYPGLEGPLDLPDPQTPNKLAFVETANWAKVAPALQQAFHNRIDQLAKTGINIITRSQSEGVRILEADLSSVFPATRTIVTWESRWPLNIFSDMDATKLSESMRTRLRDAERMTIDEYRHAISERERIRTAYAELIKSENLDACITLSANGPAPVGLASTGDPGFATPCSYLGVPSVSLPLMSMDGLPIGIQLMGSLNSDAKLFSIASAIAAILAPERKYNNPH